MKVLIFLALVSLVFGKSIPEEQKDFEPAETIEKSIPEEQEDFEPETIEKSIPEEQEDSEPGNEMTFAEIQKDLEKVIDNSLKEPLNLVQEEPTHHNAVVSATPASRGPSQKEVLKKVYKAISDFVNAMRKSLIKDEKINSEIYGFYKDILPALKRRSFRIARIIIKSHGK